jgi:protein-S-isoprenylcysteine O-methyltransferase Ste14
VLPRLEAPAGRLMVEHARGHGRGYARVVSCERWLRLLALMAIVPAAATLYFAVFWRWFDFWRRHRVATYVMMLGTLGAVAACAYVGRGVVLAHRVGVPRPVAVIGWIAIALTTVFGYVADRQIGSRVRSFAPFFDDRGITLVTTGAYAVVRHPIYASGVGFQLGVLLVTGYLAVAAALVVFAAGAAWFTRQEERRLIELLADRDAYARYRARVPGLFPLPRRR